MTPFRLTLRRLLRAPLFTVITVLTLGIGIGANAAVFAVIRAVLLEPLPFEEPERLVGVWHTAPGAGFPQVNMSPATYFTYREDARGVFEDVALWDDTQFPVTGTDEPEQVDALLVTDGLFPLLGVQPRTGRLFTRDDDAPGAPRTVILSWGYWQRRFGDDPGVVGRTLRISGNETEIIAVMPERLRFLDRSPALFMPFRFDPTDLSMGDFSYQGVARLRPGVTIAQANAEVERLIPVSVERFPGGLSLAQLRDAGFGPDVHALEEDVIGDISRVLWILLGAVGLVLLIACANVANLFLVRAEGQTREIAVRIAMGAGRRQVAGWFLRESVVLGVFGGAVGLGLAAAGIRLLVTAGPRTLPRLAEIDVDPMVLLFTFVISVLAGLLFGGLALLRHGRPLLTTALREGGRGASTSRETHRTRSALVVGQVALALVLLIGSGLMIRTLQALRDVHPGFERPDEVLTVRVSIPAAEVASDLAAAQMHEAILGRIAAIPGVGSVGASTSITMDSYDSNDAVEVEAFPTPPDALAPVRRIKFVAPGYFETMENPILAGRSITWQDSHTPLPVVVVTENFARAYWTDPALAIGQRVRASLGGEWKEIVGVVGDARDNGVDRDAPPIVYFPMVVAGMWGQDLLVRRSLGYAIRSTLPAASILPQVRAAVWQTSRNLPLANVRTLREILNQSMARSSFTLVMLGIAAAVALLLGAIGLYGVISYIVAQRTREIGVRVALGARSADVRHLVLRHGLTVTGLGILIGLGSAAAVTRLMSSVLFGVSPLDPLTFAAVAGV
ncbi:MAG: ABC transporter permease, partial [Gemmatimonadetes bacterium]|nr:ABC transporter permease [Gemmatimonadota bacterium]